MSAGVCIIIITCINMTCIIRPHCVARRRASFLLRSVLLKRAECVAQRARPRKQRGTRQWRVACVPGARSLTTMCTASAKHPLIFIVKHENECIRLALGRV